MLSLQFAAIQDEVSWDARELLARFPWCVVVGIGLAIVALLVFATRNRTKA